jgi:hypothetical protein
LHEHFRRCWRHRAYKKHMTPVLIKLFSLSHSHFSRYDMTMMITCLMVFWSLSFEWNSFKDSKDIKTIKVVFYCLLQAFYSLFIFSHSYSLFLKCNGLNWALLVSVRYKNAIKKLPALQVVISCCTF